MSCTGTAGRLYGVMRVQNDELSQTHHILPSYYMIFNINFDLFPKGSFALPIS